MDTSISSHSVCQERDVQRNSEETAHPRRGALLEHLEKAGWLDEARAIAGKQVPWSWMQLYSDQCDPVQMHPTISPLPGLPFLTQEQLSGWPLRPRLVLGYRFSLFIIPFGFLCDLCFWKAKQFNFLL